MTAIDDGAKVAPMTKTKDQGEPRSKLLADRMAQLGVLKADLVRSSGVAQNTVTKYLAPEPGARLRDSVYDNLFRVLDAIEADRQPGTQHYTPDGVPDLVTIQMTGVFGIESVTFSGPTDDADALKEAAIDFVRQVREGRAAD